MGDILVEIGQRWETPFNVCHRVLIRVAIRVELVVKDIDEGEELVPGVNVVVLIDSPFLGPIATVDVSKWRIIDLRFFDVLGDRKTIKMAIDLERIDVGSVFN